MRKLKRPTPNRGTRVRVREVVLRFKDDGSLGEILFDILAGKMNGKEFVSTENHHHSISPENIKPTLRKRIEKELSNCGLEQCCEFMGLTLEDPS